MECRPSRAALGVSFTAAPAFQVRPSSVELHVSRFAPLMAETTMAVGVIATRGPRWRPRFKPGTLV